MNQEEEPSAAEGEIVPEALDTIEFPTREVRESRYRFSIAIIATAGYVILLFLALWMDANSGGTLSLFEKVAAAISGPVGAIWGYYFGKKED